MKFKEFDAVVVGSGHAGCEACLALARMGIKTILLTLNLDSIAFLACNPSIGGTAKGQLVAEIDALGGEMGVNADKCTIQSRMLNSSKGPAVQSLRVQADKVMYHTEMKKTLENQKNLVVRQGEVTSLIVKNGKIQGVKVATGDEYYSKAVVICTGVYLKSRVIIGNCIENTGPNGFAPANKLTKSLIKNGFEIFRFKTGTPVRIHADTIDYSKCEEQLGDEFTPNFSTITKNKKKNLTKCYLTYTNLNTHEIILNNLDKAPMYSGIIKGEGPRYCPSIETKVVRFADKQRHQLFIEPESLSTKEMYLQGFSPRYCPSIETKVVRFADKQRHQLFIEPESLSTKEMYLQGFSTSMPSSIQYQMVHSLAGLENAQIMRDAYAIEYDLINSLQLDATLQAKHISGLYFAGQVNGTSGYEEAGAQGIMAGINAALKIKGKDPFILHRNEAYIGVLIDDLVTKGTLEPYRMMTSRAEYRLHLRQTNADLRLTQKGYELGLVTKSRYNIFLKRKEQILEVLNSLETVYSPKKLEKLFTDKNETLPKVGIKLKDVLKRNNINIYDIVKYLGLFDNYSGNVLDEVQTEVKYEGYINRQNVQINTLKKQETTLLPQDINYMDIKGLRIEARQKLDKIKPLTLGQASRISGVSPADIAVLTVYLKTLKTHR